MCTMRSAHYQPKVVLATLNSGKLYEMRDALSHCAIDWVSQADLGVCAAEETAVTFVENALLKARHAAAASGLPALAEDSGLAVKALAGEPGLFSARYAGKAASSQQNVERVLQRFSDIPEPKTREAFFYAAMVLVCDEDDPIPLIFQGTWRGELLSSPCGDGGFGYDPIFYVPEHHCSAAELEISIKNRISHRAKALQALLAAQELVFQKIKCA